MPPRNLLWTVAVVMILALAVSACTTVEPQSPAGEVPEEVVIGLNIDASSLDPHFASSSQEYGMLKNVVEHLVWVNYDTGGFDPRLATSWEQVDQLTWEFKLRQGVTFQNGEPFNAEAVEYSIARCVDPELKTLCRFGGAVSLDRTEVVDDYTIRIITKTPSPTMLRNLWILQIVPKEYYSTTPLEELALMPVGSGPYQLVEWVKDERIVFEAWDGYWGPAPAMKRIVYRPLPELSTRLAELETGGIDVAIDISPDNLKTLEGIAGVDIRQVQSGRRVAIAIRSSGVEPLDNPLVRQALNYAVNWDSINRNILSGIGTRMATWVTSPFENPELEPYPYDPDKAKEMLAEAGLADGFEVTLEVPIARYLKGEDICQAIAADLENIGIDVNLVLLEWSVYAQKMFREKDPAGLFLVGLSSAFNPFDDLTNFDPAFVFANYHWEDEEYVGLLRAYPTADEAERQNISYQAQKIIHDRGPVIMLWRQVQIYGVNDRIEWSPRPDDYIFGEEFAPAQ